MAVTCERLALHKRSHAKPDQMMADWLHHRLRNNAAKRTEAGSRVQRDKEIKNLERNCFLVAYIFIALVVASVFLLTKKYEDHRIMNTKWILTKWESMGFDSACQYGMQFGMNFGSNWNITINNGSMLKFCSYERSIFNRMKIRNIGGRMVCIGYPLNCAGKHWTHEGAKKLETLEDRLMRNSFGYTVKDSILTIKVRKNSIAVFQRKDW